jgi:hypothetical protein
MLIAIPCGVAKNTTSQSDSDLSPGSEKQRDVTAQIGKEIRTGRPASPREVMTVSSTCGWAAATTAAPPRVAGTTHDAR